MSRSGNSHRRSLDPQDTNVAGRENSNVRKLSGSIDEDKEVDFVSSNSYDDLKGITFDHQFNVKNTVDNKKISSDTPLENIPNQKSEQKTRTDVSVDIQEEEEEEEEEASSSDTKSKDPFAFVSGLMATNNKKLLPPKKKSSTVIPPEGKHVKYVENYVKHKSKHEQANSNNTRAQKTQKTRSQRSEKSNKENSNWVDHGALDNEVVNCDSSDSEDNMAHTDIQDRNGILNEDTMATQISSSPVF